MSRFTRTRKHTAAMHLPQPLAVGPDAYKRANEMPFADLVHYLALQYVTPSHNGQPATEANTQIIRTAANRKDTQGMPVTIGRDKRMQLRGYSMNAKRVHIALLTGAWPVAQANGRDRTDLPFGLGLADPDDRAAELAMSLAMRMDPYNLHLGDHEGGRYLASPEERFKWCQRYDQFLGKPDGAPEVPPPDL